MKKITLVFITAFLLLSFSDSIAKNQRAFYSQTRSFEKVLKDKAFLLDYFQKTDHELQKSVAGLSKGQLQFKSSPDRWSVSQCLEHIILTEKALFDMAKELLAKPANPERREEVKTTDQDLINGISNRSTKAKAPEQLQPKGIYTDPDTAMKALRKQRAEILALIDATSLEVLRNHIGDSPFGAIDAYQSFLFIAGHTARHTLQVKEVKADTDFPK